MTSIAPQGLASQSQSPSPHQQVLMVHRALAALVLLAAGAQALQLKNTDEEWKERPVTKVVNLLKDMLAQLEKEAANDEELYDKLVCWCETNEKEKTKAVEIANQAISDSTAAIEEFAAKTSQLTTDIEALKKEIAANTAALEEATGLRTKDNAEFNTNEKDAIASISSLKSAVVTLGKHHEGSSLLQRQTLMQLTTMLRRHLQTKPALLSETMAPHQRQVLMTLLQRPDGMLSLMQQPAGFQSYASGEIFGIINQMKETFETNLESSRKDEAESSKSFDSLKAAKSAEIKAAQDKVFNKEEESAEALKKNEEAKETLSNMRAALEADTNFLAGLKKTCAVTDEDWEARSKMRADEIAAVSDTIAMLTGDDARDLMSKSLGFVQLRAQSQRNAVQRAQAVQFLAEAGKRLKSPRVAYLATRMRFDPFGKLRGSIDGMVGSLGKEKEDEIA